MARLKREFDEAVVAAKNLSGGAITGAAGAIAGGFGFNLSSQFRAAEAVKGGFSGASIGQQFGVSNQAGKQTELLRQIAQGEGALPDKIGAAVGKSVVFK